MKRMIIFVLMMMLGLFTMRAEKIFHRSHSLPLPANAEVVIELDGEINIHARRLPEVDIDVDNIVSGSVFGLQFNGKAKYRYDVVLEQKKGRLLIKEKPVGVTFTIGITSISTRHIHDIYLPKSARVTIRSNTGKINVDGCFSSLDISNREGDSSVRLMRGQVKLMACDAAKGEIIVDGSAKGPRFLYEGKGNGHYRFSTEKGKIKVRISTL